MDDQQRVHSLSILTRLWKMSSRNAFLVGLWFLGICISAGASLVTARYLGRGGEAAVAGRLQDVLTTLTVTAVAAGANMIFSSLSCWALGKFTQDTALSFRSHTAKRLAQASYPWLEGQKTGDLIERANSNMQHAIDYLCSHVPELISVSTTAVFSIIFIVLMEWRLALIYLAVFPLVVLMQNQFSKPMEQKMSDVYKAEGRRTALAENALTNRSTVRAYVLEEEMDLQYRNRFMEYFTASVQAFRLQVLLLFPSIMISLLPACTLYICAAIFIFKGWFTISGLLSFVVLTEPLSERLWKLSTRLMNLRSAAAGAKRIFEIWDAPQEKTAIGLPIEPQNHETLRFDEVDFSYIEEEPVLSKLSFHVSKGEKVALVGRSGCGKSTVLKLVAGLYKPTGGKITLWGQDVTFAAPEALRQQMAFIPQDTYLFPESIRGNVLHGKPDANESGLIEACRQANMDFLKDLPQDMDTLVGERGTQLSGGQRQRVAIARAFLRDAQLVLLDEATSALDALAERQVQDALDNLLEGRTALIIAHRLSSIRNADRILVLDEGRIVEEGTFDSLMLKNGLYAQLYRRQLEEEVA